MFEAVSQLAAEHAELEVKLADPSVHSDQSLARRLGQRYAELSSVLRAHDEWVQLGGNLEAARELAGEDESFATRGRGADPRPAHGRGAAAPAADPARPLRRQGRPARGQVG